MDSKPNTIFYNAISLFTIYPVADSFLINCCSFYTCFCICEIFKKGENITQTHSCSA